MGLRNLSKITVLNEVELIQKTPMCKWIPTYLGMHFVEI